MNEAYFVLPDFVKLTQNVKTVDEFDETVIPKLVAMYNDLADDYATAESHDYVVTLTTLAIGHDAENVAAYQLRSAAYDALNKTDLPEPDSPTMPSIWPFSSSKFTPLTAWTTRSKSGGQSGRRSRSDGGVANARRSSGARRG